MAWGTGSWGQGSWGSNGPIRRHRQADFDVCGALVTATVTRADGTVEFVRADGTFVVISPAVERDEAMPVSATKTLEELIDQARKGNDWNVIRPVAPAPRGAKFLLYCCPRKYRENLIGDLEEDYNIVLRERGPRHAWVACWSQLIWSLAPLLWTLLVRSTFATAAAGAVSWLWQKLGH